MVSTAQSKSLTSPNIMVFKTDQVGTFSETKMLELEAHMCASLFHISRINHQAGFFL